MSALRKEDIKRRTAKCKIALVLHIIQGRITVPEASRTYDQTPSEVLDNGLFTAEGNKLWPLIEREVHDLAEVAFGF